MNTSVYRIMAITSVFQTDDVSSILTTRLFRGVAQPGSASGLGPEGRRFKSCLPDHLNRINHMTNILLDIFTLGAAIFIGSVAYDWWRRRNL